MIFIRSKTIIYLSKYLFIYGATVVVRIGRVGHIYIRRRRIGHVKMLRILGAVHGCESVNKNKT